MGGDEHSENALCTYVLGSFMSACRKLELAERRELQAKIGEHIHTKIGTRMPIG